MNPAALSPIFDGATDWGFGASDVWTNAMAITGSVSGFIVLGIVVAFAPRVFGIIRKAITGGGGK